MPAILAFLLRIAGGFGGHKLIQSLLGKVGSGALGGTASKVAGHGFTKAVAPFAGFLGGDIATGAVLDALVPQNDTDVTNDDNFSRLLTQMQQPTQPDENLRNFMALLEREGEELTGGEFI